MSVEKVSAEVFLGGDNCVIHFGNPMGHPRSKAAASRPATPEPPGPVQPAARPAEPHDDWALADHKDRDQT